MYYARLSALRIYCGTYADTQEVLLEEELDLSAACVKRIFQRCIDHGCIPSLTPWPTEDKNLPRGCLEVECFHFPATGETDVTQLANDIKEIVLEEYSKHTPS